MKKLLLLVPLGFILTVAFNQTITCDSILGYWYTSENESIVEIYKKNNQYFGRLYWLKEPYEAGKIKKDYKNPNPALRDRSLLGLVFIFNFICESPGSWTGGTIYNAQDGSTYKAEISMESIDKLKVRGYIGLPCFGMTTEWTRKK